MPKEYSRTQRIADMIQRELAMLIQRELSDPRLNLITVTTVQVSPDLSHAKVYITQHKTEEEIKQTLKVLNKAANHLRYLLAHAIKLRVVPQLRFYYDASVSYSAHLSSLIDDVIAQDERKHKE